MTRRGRFRLWLSRAGDAARRFAVAVRDYAVRPIEGAIKRHVGPAEFLDVLLAAMATGGLSNAVLYVAQHSGTFLRDVDPAWMSCIASALAMLARLLQRYHQGGPPATPA
jgi:hypothetical protein